MGLFKTPDLTGWSYEADVKKEHAEIVVKDPSGCYWYNVNKQPTPYERQQRDGYYSTIKKFNIMSITEAGIEKGAKKVILKCKRIYDKEARKNAIRADSHVKEF